VTHLRRIHDTDQIFVRHVFEERCEIDFLLVVAAERGRGGLPDDRENRHMIGFRVVQAVEQMDRSGAARRQTHA
jgi:hypothetical protein